MIVSCPSCHTRYRFHGAGGAAEHGRCSRCDETVPLVRARRSYVLIPARLRAALDEPRLAGPAGSARGGVPRPVRVGRSWPEPRSRSVLREWVGLLLLTGLGAAAALHVSALRQGDPFTWAAVGSVVGLLVGWSWIRGAERRR